MEPRMSRRDLLKLTAALGAGSVLSGCGASPTTVPTAAVVAPQKPTSINWLEWWVNEWGKENHDALINGFLAANPDIKLDVVDVGYDEMLPKLQTAAMSGTGWDLFGNEPEWLVPWIQLGMAEDLTPWLEKAGPAFNDRLTNMTPVYWQGKPYMLYLYLVSFNLAYDAAKLKAMEIEPPTNWDEFYNACKKFRDKGEYGYGMSLRPDSDAFTGKMWALRHCQAGGMFVTPEGEVVFNKEPGIIATEWWKKFYQDGLALPGSETEDKQTTSENLATGKIAMTIEGPYIRAQCQQINPNSDVHWCPAWTQETGGYLWGGSGICMWAKGEHKEQAWKFIEYFFQDEIMLPLSQKTSTPFALKSVLAQPGLENDPILHALPAMVSQDPEHSWAFSPIPDLGTLYIALSEAVIGCVKGDRKDIKGTLDEVAGLWQKTLDEAAKAS